MTWKPVVLLAIGVSVLLRLEPVEVVVYLGGAPGPASIDAIVTEAACRYIRAEEVPLPLPYTVRVLKRAGESLRFTPQPAPIATGLLSWCPGAVSALPALSGSGSRAPKAAYQGKHDQDHAPHFRARRPDLVRPRRVRRPARDSDTSGVRIARSSRIRQPVVSSPTPEARDS